MSLSSHMGIFSRAPYKRSNEALSKTKRILLRPLHIRTHLDLGLERHIPLHIPPTGLPLPGIALSEPNQDPDHDEDDNDACGDPKTISRHPPTAIRRVEEII